MKLILILLLAPLVVMHAADTKTAKPIPEYPIPPVVMQSKPIQIDVGLQLFVDDWLITETTLRRTFHQARVHDGPVLKAETKLERGTAEGAVLSDGGVWFDAKDKLFKSTSPTCAPAINSIST